MNSFNINNLPIKDLVVSSLIILIMSLITANLYKPLVGYIYALANIVTLAFLSWLYKDSWKNPNN